MKRTNRSARKRSRWRLVRAGFVLALASHLCRPATAIAQVSTTLVQPSVAPDYDRDRNVSVAERPRPDYDPQGISAGAFLIYPRADIGAGLTSNVNFDSTDDQTGGFTLFAPSARVTSDWSRHQLAAGAHLQYLRYQGGGRRDELSWDANLLGRYDMGSDLAFGAEFQAAKLYETPFSGQIGTDIIGLSSYRHATALARGQYTGGRVRVTSVYDHNTYRFSDLRFTSGLKEEQRDRDRDFDRLTVTVEYALSPGLSTFAQASYTGTNYLLDNGYPSRDSGAERVIVGGTLDVAGLARGSLGIGYVRRNYTAPSFQDVAGFSAEAKVELFPSELTTVTVAAHRTLDDAIFVDTSAYFDNQISLSVDHELLVNLLLNASTSYTKQDFAGSGRVNDIYQLHAGARYSFSRSVVLRCDASYSSLKQRGTALDESLDELRGELSLTFQI